MLEADYEGEIINSLDVVDYYATYGHTANIELFHLVADDTSGHPYDLRVCIGICYLVPLHTPALLLPDARVCTGKHCNMGNTAWCDVGTPHHLLIKAN